MKTKTAIFIAAWTMIFLPGPAAGETLRGRLAAVDPEGQSVTVLVAPKEEAERPLKILVSADAFVPGPPSLESLGVGDPVEITGARNRDTGLWETDSIRLEKMRDKKEES